MILVQLLFNAVTIDLQIVQHDCATLVAGRLAVLQLERQVTQDVRDDAWADWTLKQFRAIYNQDLNEDEREMALTDWAAKMFPSEMDADEQFRLRTILHAEALGLADNYTPEYTEEARADVSGCTAALCSVT